MEELFSEAISFGWPMLALIVAVFLFKQRRVADAEAKKDLRFNTILGLICGVLFLMAIVNYRNSFGISDGMLPVSLVMITVLAFVTGTYYTNIGALMKIGGFMFLVAAILSGYGNWLPQVEGGFPPPEVKLDFQSMSKQQLGDEGENIIFGGLGQSKVQGAIGKGQCPLCHGFNKGFLSERAPNLFDIPARAIKQLDHPKYHKGNPEARDTVKKEAHPGSGTAETGQEYIAESHACPNCFVVPGFGVKGSNDTESPMPRIHKPPISLTIGELAAVDTWLYVREGVEAPAYDEIAASYEKFIPEEDRAKASSGGDAAGGVLATGEEPITDLFMKAGCPACHTIPGIKDAVGKVGPLLAEGSSAPKRLKDPNYKGHAGSVREYITESILSPSAYVVTDFPDGQMPKNFGQVLSAGAVNKIVSYLSRVKDGQEPPPLEDFE